jgi:hypothetical protein
LQEPNVDKSAAIPNLPRFLVASVAQLVEQLILNLKMGFVRFSLAFARVENSYNFERSNF